jgi:serine O-acetyltransferase
MDEVPIDVDSTDRFVARLVYWRLGDKKWRRRFANRGLKLIGCDWRPSEVGEGLRMPHSTTGSVVHSRTKLGANVTIMQGATLGRSDSWRPGGSDGTEGLVVEDDVVIGANATVLFRSGQVVTVARGSIVGAGAVLSESTGEHEVWAGSPARKVGTR